ncbi:MAG: type 4a pilus biogenesis protein PilO [Bacteroidota bacterium]
MIPRLVELRAQYTETSNEQATLASLDKWAYEKRLVEARSVQLQQRFKDLYVSLPRSDQMSTILGLLHEHADQFGVRLTEVRPAERMAYARYDQWPVALHIEGDFHAVGRFVATIEQAQYLMKVAQLELWQDGALGAVLKGQLDLHVIILKES